MVHEVPKNKFSQQSTKALSDLYSNQNKGGGGKHLLVLPDRRLQTLYWRFWTFSQFYILASLHNPEFLSEEWSDSLRKDCVFIFFFSTKSNRCSSLFTSCVTYTLSIWWEKILAHYFGMINNHNFISLFSYWNCSSPILECIAPPDTHTNTIMKS